MDQPAGRIVDDPAVDSHGAAPYDMPELIAAIAAELNAVWRITPLTTMLSRSASLFTIRD